MNIASGDWPPVRRSNSSRCVEKILREKWWSPLKSFCIESVIGFWRVYHLATVCGKALQFAQAAQSRSSASGAVILPMPPESPSSSTRALARQLIAATQAEAREAQAHVVIKVTDRLRLALTKFAGADSFASLLRRALVLASTEVPGLKTVKVGEDGRLRGIAESLPQTEGAADDAAIAIASHVLELLDTFIGLPFTIRLIRNAWPDISLDTYQSRTEDEA